MEIKPEIEYSLRKPVLYSRALVTGGGKRAFLNSQRIPNVCLLTLSQLATGRKLLGTIVVLGSYLQFRSFLVIYSRNEGGDTHIPMPKLRRCFTRHLCAQKWLCKLTQDENVKYTSCILAVTIMRFCAWPNPKGLCDWAGSSRLLT